MDFTKKELKMIEALLEKETSQSDGEDDLLYLHAWDAWGFQGQNYMKLLEKVSAMCGKEKRK